MEGSRVYGGLGRAGRLRWRPIGIDVCRSYMLRNQVAVRDMKLGIENSRQNSIRSEVLNLSLLTFGSFCAIAIAAVWIDIILNQWSEINFTYSLIGCIVCVLAIFRHRVSFFVRASGLIFFLASLGTYGLITYGQYAPSTMFLMAVPVFTALYFGVRAGLLAAGCCVLAHLGIGAAGLVFQWFEIIPRYEPGANLVFDWFLLTLSFVACVMALTLSVRRTLFSMGETLRELTAEREALREARGRAEAANKAKSDFLAAMSHDLRTPLNPILGFAELIEKRMLGDRAIATYSDYAKCIREAGQTLMATLGKILDLSRMEARAVDIAAGEVDLLRLVNDAVGDFRDAADAVEVRVLVQGQVPPVLADRRFIDQALRHLIENAIRHSPAGGTVTIVAESTPNAAVRVTVLDEGPGVRPQVIRHVGEPFIISGNPYQASNSFRRNSVGLGLALATRIMGRHGGAFTLRNRPHGGAEATLVFPPDRTGPQVSSAGSSEVVATSADAVRDIEVPSSPKSAERNWFPGETAARVLHRHFSNPQAHAKASEIEKEKLAQIRSDVCNLCLITIAPLAAIGTFQFSAHLIAHGWELIWFVYAVVGFCLVSAALFRQFISVEIRAAMIFSFLFFIGVMGVFLFGPYADDLFFLILIPVFATILYGSIPGIISTLFVIVLYAGLGAASNIYEFMEIRQRFLYGGSRFYDWSLLSISFAMSMLAMTIAVTKTLAAMNEALQSIEAERVSHQAARDKAQAANKTKADFLAAMSHDLRTPLTPIIGFAEVIEHRLMGDDAIEKYADQAKNIRQAGQNLLTTLGTILDLSKLEAGEIEMTEGPVDLASTAQQAADIIVGQPRANAVFFAFEGTVPKVLGDPDLVRRIVYNLIDNAVRHSPEDGNIKIQLAVTTDNEVTFAVVDNGPGFRPEIAARIGEPFVVGPDPYRASDTADHHAVGLGLSIVTRLMALHGGRFAIENRPEGGATATIVFPAFRTGPPE